MKYTAEDFETLLKVYDRKDVNGYLNAKIICVARVVEGVGKIASSALARIYPPDPP